MKKLFVLLCILIFTSVLLASCAFYGAPLTSTDDGESDGGEDFGGFENGIFVVGDGEYPEDDGIANGETATVTFDCDGGTAIDPQTVAIGETLSIPGVPTKPGYVFEGWYFGEFAWDFELMPVMQDITLKARWVLFVPKLTTLSSEPSSCSCSNYKNSYTASGSSVTIVATPGPGYQFVGWYEGETLLSTGAEYTFTMPAKDLEYTAKFEPKPEMAPFLFFSGKDYCGIHNVIDESITEVVIPDCVTYIDEFAFADCTQLQSVTFSGKIDYIDDNAFKNCPALKTLTFNGSIREIGADVFAGCPAIETVNVNNYAAWCNISFDSFESNPIYLAKKFYHNGTLVTDLVLPDDVEGISHVAFYGCTALKSVTIGKGVIGIGGAAFAACTGITNMVIPDTVSSIGYGVFAGCTSLESIVLSNQIRYIDASLFSGCAALKEITLPDSVWEIDEYAFYGCTSLKSVNIPVNVTKISKFAFYNCTALERINFDAKSCRDSLDTRLVFVNAGLESEGITLIFGNTVERIPAKMFYNSVSKPNTQKQPNIKTVIIGKNVTEIGQQVFYECATIQSMKYRGTKAQWEAITKGLYWNTHVPAPDYVMTVIGYTMSYDCTE